MNAPTAAQQSAVNARGNVLVEAGAGAGKTRTLVDRCLHWLENEDSPGSLDEILMVTFTEAAAAEMRHRLRAELDKRIAGSLSPKMARHLGEQSALLDTAWICTLHSFCFQLVRQHFYKLGLDPRLALLAPERTAVCQRQALTAILDQHYRNETPQAHAILQLIEAHGRDWDKPVCDLILRLHTYAQSLPDPAAWFDGQRANFEQPQPDQWRAWLMAELAELRPKWTRAFQTHTAQNAVAGQCAAILLNLPPQPSREQFAVALEAICAPREARAPKPPKATEPIFKEARFLRSLCATTSIDPLAEDWDWARHPMLTLLALAQEFGRSYARVKQDAGGVDFQDLEQFALRLLWERATARPSEIAAQWRKKLRMIFVDEYQDINGAQEAIIAALGREGAEANRFLVGDVKQSIYRFRLADPRIFSKRKNAWKTEARGRVIALSENFRSHEAILHFVNSLFDSLMCQEIGGIDYDCDARLRFGNAAQRVHMAAGNGPPPVELHLRLADGPADDGEGAPSSDAEKEARIVARRLADLKLQGTSVWDKDHNERRPVKWSDMVVLLRAPRGKAETYVKAFEDAGVPLAAARAGFYDSLEARDLISLLTILDNPLQDVPLLGVLMSPLAGLAAGELATIRLARRPCHFWFALNHWHEQAARPGGAASPLEKRLLNKVSRFLDFFRAWRRLSRQRPVSHCLETVLDQTHYADWLAAQKRGRQRVANVGQLLQLTRQFDSDRGEGLYRFLKFVEAQQKHEVDVEPAGAPMTDAVRLMSIHQSKGLEFPIVALPDLAKKFNLQDTHARVILDERLGLCPQVKPPGGRRFYPSLAHWLAARRQKRETYGEEMRLLYVAATRACERLILSGAIGQKTVPEKWPDLAATEKGAAQVLAAGSYLDWIGTWLAKTNDPAALEADGQSSLLRWFYHNEASGHLPSTTPPTECEADAGDGGASTPVGALDLRRIRERLQWNYSFQPATRLPAKTAVSGLRRQIAPANDEESQPLFSLGPSPLSRRAKAKPGQLSAAESGLAHHAFLELAQLDRLSSAAGLNDEAARLCRQRLLSADQISCLDFDALAAFWQSDIGRQFLSQAEYIRRELAFTARFSCGELFQLGAAEFAGAGEKEFVVVQGVIDLAAVLPGELWLLDFKTDRFASAQQDARVEMYRPQLVLYAAAAARIYRPAVTPPWVQFLTARKSVALE